MAAATERQPGTPSTEDILKEVRHFVKGSTFKSKVTSEELAQSALFLLRVLPSARQAVLEHLCNVFDEAVNKHILQIETGNKIMDNEAAGLNSIIEDVKDVMMDFVKSNPDAWAPIISAWSIELLGRLSSQYSGRRAVPHTYSLNELLQLWMTCPPTSVLIEIASGCFASMVGSTPDVCVSALLEASVKHSPHFDWVVAHIGSCFPTTIITRVLMCGLKDFYLHGSSQPELSACEEKVPKLASVVGILGHLAAQHQHDIRKALVNLFQESLREDCEEMHLAAVPFLLHLASMSPLLLRIITLDFVNTVTPSILNKLARQFSQKKARGSQDKSALIPLLVHLITTSDVGSYKILQFLLDTAFPIHQKDDAMDTDEAPVEIVQQTCSTIMEHLLLDLQQSVQRQSSGAAEVSFLLTLQDHTADLCHQLVRAEGKRYEWLSQIVCCVAAYCDDSCAAALLSKVLQETAESAQLGVFIRIQHDAQVFHPEVLALTTRAVVEALSASPAPAARTKTVLRNLLRLAQWECKQEGRAQARHSLQEALHASLPGLTPCLYHADNEVAAIAMELLNIVGLPWKLGIDSLTKLCFATTFFFFRCLHSSESAVKCQNARLCHRFMQTLSRHSAAQRILTRFLIEETLSKEHCAVFGSKVCLDAAAGDTHQPAPKLLQANARRAPSNLPQGRARVFHGGVIGQGLKPRPRASPYTQEEKIGNRELLLEALWVCSTQSAREEEEEEGGAGRPAGAIGPHVGRCMALLLIEQVAPDVMYNGIPWPEEDFMKVTIERDLQIRKTFDDNPVLWDIMDVLSHSAGAVCYCSALLRGVAATLIAQWDSCRERTARNMPHYLAASQRLMECLRKGALLPAPLCFVGELFPDLAPHEVCLLLHMVWRYMKENPPVPDPKENLSRGCDRRYTDVIQSIVHTNIDKLGHLYNRFNPQPAKFVAPITERLLSHANSDSSVVLL